MPDRKNYLIRIFSASAFFEGVLVLLFLLDIPADAKNALFFGLSASRLALVGFVFLTAAFCAGLFLFAPRAAGAVDIFFSKPQNQTRTEVLTVFGAGLAALFLCLPAERLGVALYQRLLPTVIFLLLLTIQTWVGQRLWLKQTLDFSQVLKNRGMFRTFAILLALTGLLSTWIAWSGIGMDREPSGWLSPGTPLLFQQVLFSVFIGFLFFIFREKFNWKLDFTIGLLIWLFAGLWWWSQPLTRHGYFNPDPTPPNFEYYPYSDAQNYDLFAQNFLIGEGRKVGLTYRPLYSIFLAFLHALGGPGFERVLFLQVFTLALIPALVYALVSSLGGRAAGGMSAALIIFRESNSIALTNIIEVSHSKLIMSDVPTMLMMVGFIYFFVQWFRAKEERYVYGVLAGVFLGFSIYIRSQAQLLIPIALLGICWLEKFKWRVFFRKALIFLLGGLVVVAPWVWRNYQLSGRVLVEYLNFYTRFIASSYATSPQDVNLLPGETDEQYRTRVKGQVIAYIIERPAEVARFYSAYFIHNEVASLAFLPMSLKFETLYQYVETLGFWDAPYLGRVPLRFSFIFFATLALALLGLAAAIRNVGYLGWMPLLFHLGYSLSSVPVRQSGWRFILPVDWILLLYFCIGLAEFCFLCASVFLKLNPVAIEGLTDPTLRKTSWRGVKPTLAFFALLGLGIPWVEWRIPERYPAVEPGAVIREQFQAETVDASALKMFLETEPGAIVWSGRALYPAYYLTGEFWGESSPMLLEASRYNRLQFNLIGSRNAFVFLPLQQAPEYFPHAADVFIIGCQQKNSARALLVNVNGRVISADPWPGLNCSTSE
ncbi:MAG: glycosyltransferase family 39 protein [Anaerolineales bacterium]|nr:glycosyltransferase family 39 protein [Anaerolineales bacterium]